MEALDTTIAVVALRYTTNAIIPPITGWLMAHIGRRNYFLLSIAVFTLASGLCGMATSLGQLIPSRVLQGLAGGGLQPSSWGVLLDAFPVERQGMAMTLFGLAVLIAPVVGPTLGLGACAITLRDPDHLTAQRMELLKRLFSFDGIGLSLLVIVIVCWEVTLSKGLTAFAVLYAASTSLPALLHSLFGYDALSAELVMSPPGFFAVVTKPFVRLALGRGTDARWVRGSVDHGREELLDVTVEPGRQSRGTRLAAECC
jgi:MFS transporter, DHA2 family, multidrug resistance protein